MKKLIVGLGNPDNKYKDTRHNTGYLIIDSLLGNTQEWKENKKFNSFISEHNNNIFCKPLTYMNLSGTAVFPFSTAGKYIENLVPRFISLKSSICPS